MCATCGCGNQDGVVILKTNGEHIHLDHNGNHHHHDGDHHHHHEHDGGHHHHHPADQPGPLSRELRLELDVLRQNDLLAERNRGYFEAKEIAALNLVSSPGSGKTSLLEKTIAARAGARPISVIEGDQQTLNDARRIEAAGAKAVQINTGSGCHLDARMVNLALKQLQPQQGSLLFIENVGNLVCPAAFDLGERLRVVIVSVTEGHDKPLKYPDMFRGSQWCVINKTDLLPYVDFEVEKMKEYARRVNPDLRFVELSATTGQGMETWLNWLDELA